MLSFYFFQELGVQGYVMVHDNSTTTVIYHLLLIYHCFSIRLCLSRQAGEFDISQNLANNARTHARTRATTRNRIADAQELHLHKLCTCTRIAPAIRLHLHTLCKYKLIANAIQLQVQSNCRCIACVYPSIRMDGYITYGTHLALAIVQLFTIVSIHTTY